MEGFLPQLTPWNPHHPHHLLGRDSLRYTITPSTTTPPHSHPTTSVQRHCCLTAHEARERSYLSDPLRGAERECSTCKRELAYAYERYHADIESLCDYSMGCGPQQVGSFAFDQINVCMRKRCHHCLSQVGMPTTVIGRGR